MPFRLRSVIRGHDADVRTVCPALYPEGAILTGSRDQTCRLWVRDEEDGNFTEGHVFNGHTRYISAVTTIPPSEKYPHGNISFKSSKKPASVAYARTPRKTISLYCMYKWCPLPRHRQSQRSLVDRRLSLNNGKRLQEDKKY